MQTRLLRADAAGGPFDTVVATLPASAGTTTVVDTLVQNGVAVFYAAVAVDSEGLASAPSAPTAATPVDEPAASPLAGLVASGQAGGVVELSWLPPPDDDFARFRVYRAAAPFTDPADATLLVEPLEPRFDDVPATEGLFHYAVSWVDLGGNESALSPSVSAVADRTAPAGDVVINAVPVDGPAGIGTRALTLALTEAPGAPPSLRFLAPGRAPVDLLLVVDGVNPLVFRGSVDVAEGTAAGVASFALRVRDAVGNEGTGLTRAGGGAVLDVDGTRPTAVVATDPASPVRVGTVRVSLRASERVDATPSLTFVDAGGASRAVTLAADPAGPEGVAFSGTLDLAGAAIGSGAFQTTLVDAAGNGGTVITAGTTLVVDDAPPGAPTALVAAAAARGGIQLVWQAPADAARFRIYRDEAPVLAVDGRTPLVEVVQARFLDPPPRDGTFHYVVTAVDAAGNEGPPSNGARAVSDQTPPGAPTGLVANLSSGGDAVELSWLPPAGEPAASFELLRAEAAFPADTSGVAAVRVGITGTSVVDRPATEAAFHYAVVALDAAGLRSVASNAVVLDFDALAPRVTIGGVLDGLHARTSVTPTVTIDERNLASSSVTLDGAAFVSGTVVSAVGAEGPHTLSATATDAGGRTTVRVARFTLDVTPPAISIAGVTAGLRHTTAPVPTFSATDDNLLLVSGTLDGQPFASGTPVLREDLHTLVVTARDRAGNIATDTVSFTVDTPPLPPAIARADLSDAGVALAWDASPSGDVTAYRVSRGADVLLLSNAFSLDGGSLPRAPDVLRFEVRAVDAFGQLSTPRVLTVHPVRVAVAALGSVDAEGPRAGQELLTRGVFDRLLLSVQNDDVLPHEAGPASLALLSPAGDPLWDGADGITVDATAGRGTPLPLVVFTPPTAADDDNQLRLRLELGGGPLTPVAWEQTYAVGARFPRGLGIEPVVQGSLLRGGEASVGVRVLNAGTADLQLVTAVGAGPSPDLVVRLRDPAPGGFVLELPVRDTAATRTLTDGRAVATLAPGTSRTLRAVTFAVPADAPDTCILEVEARQVHSALDTDGALSEPGSAPVPGNASPVGFFQRRTVDVVPPPYVATASVPAAEVGAGQVVPISGVATRTDDGAPAPREVVKLVVSHGGFDETFFTRTDDDGLYTFPYFVAPEVAGVFTVSATHPLVLVREADASFVVHGLRLDPGVFQLSLSKNASFPVPFTLRNTGDTAITGLDARVVDDAGNDGITGTLRAAPPATLLPGQSTTLLVDVNAALSAADSATLLLEVTSTLGLTRQSSVRVAAFGATPTPEVQPRFLDVSLLAGSPVLRTVTVQNRGFGSWDDVRVVAPTDVAFISLATNADVGDVVPGASFSFDVLFSPQTGTASGVAQTSFQLRSSNLQDIPVNVTATTTNDATGTVEVDVTNLVFDPADPDAAIAGASVRLQSQDLFTLTFTAFTDETGHAVLSGVPAGRYTFVVSASRFTSASSSSRTAETGAVVVEPARTTTLAVALVESFIDVEWTVTPVSITDSYDVVLSTTFQTEVPVPALDTVPANQVFDMAPGASRTGQFELINLGLISAFDVRLSLRQDPALDVQLAFARIAEIPAHGRVVVPFTVQLRGAAPCTNVTATVDVAFSYFASGAGVLVQQAAFPASIDVRSHEADVLVEPNTVVRQTFIGCDGFPAGEGVVPPAITVSNAEPVDVELCGCGRLTSAGADLATLEQEILAAGDASAVELLALSLEVQADLGLPDAPDLAADIPAQLDDDGRAFYGSAPWDRLLLAARALQAATVHADAGLAALADAAPALDRGLCEANDVSDALSEATAGLGAALASPGLASTLAEVTGGVAPRYDDLHLRFDESCLGPGGGAVTTLPIDASAFSFGTLSFATATGCGAARTASCCPVSVGFVEHRVVCSAGAVSSTQAGGGGGVAGGWGGGGGGGVSVGSTTGSNEGECTR